MALANGQSRTRYVARAAGQSLPRAVRSSHGQDGAVIKHLGLVEYQPTYCAMRQFTASRHAGTADELWVVQHPPVYTVGLAGRAEHLPRSSDIRVERVDRGGQIT